MSKYVDKLEIKCGILYNERMRTFVAILFFVTVPLGFLFAQENARARFVKERLQFVEFQNYQERAGVDGETRARSKEIFILTSNRHLAAILRLEDIASRIESALRVRDAAGDDTVSTRLKLAAARVLIGESRDGLERAKNGFENMFSSASSTQVAREISRIFREDIQYKLQRAHRMLIEISISDHAQAR